MVWLDLFYLSSLQSECFVELPVVEKVCDEEKYFCVDDCMFSSVPGWLCKFGIGNAAKHCFSR